MIDSSNPISIILKFIFAILNVALAIVFGYLGTVMTYVLGLLLLAGVLFLIVA